MVHVVCFLRTSCLKSTPIVRFQLLATENFNSVIPPGSVRGDFQC